MLKNALVLPVFTAHPSEARRRTVLEKLDAIAGQFDQLEYLRLVPSERAEALDEIAGEIETFWLTDIIRDHRPTVLDEIRQGLGMVCETLFEIVPQVYRNLEVAAKTYPELAANDLFRRGESSSRPASRPASRTASRTAGISARGKRPRAGD